MATVVVGLAFASCFKGEPLNTECDIEEAYLHADNPEEMFFSPNDSLVKVLYTESVISFKVRSGNDLTQLAPTFRITPGATIAPESGSAHDFSSGYVAYEVTSEDGEWTKVYQVGVAEPEATSDTICYDFENYALNDKGKYYVWTDVNSDGSNANNWATGNPGFAISRSSAKPDEYPTTPMADGYDGAAVKLTTQDTGAFGKLKNMRIAAGNLFIGRFDATSAIMAGGALRATMFGLKYESTKRPVKFSGYYKYAPGETYQDRDGNPMAGRTDKATIYSVLYRNTDDDGNEVVLNGEDVLTNENIVAMARMAEVDRADEWTQFELEYEYRQEIDQSILDNHGYNFAVVCSSSNDGGNFEGAIGSTLYVDKLRVVCE